MVAAAKYARAERELRVGRPYGHAAGTFYQQAGANLDPDKQTAQQVLVVMTSDRGLCGAVHTNVVRNIRAKLAEPPVAGAPPVDIRLVPIGDKGRGMLYKAHGRRFLFHCNEIGRKPPLFSDASAVADELLRYYSTAGEAAAKSTAAVVHNVFKTVVSYNTTTRPLPIPGTTALAAASKLSVYDGLDDSVLRSVAEFSIVATLFFAMRESAASEQSSRMTAMDSASKNAGEMINKLTMLMNRTRQAVITRELVEIIAGAAAV